MPVYEYECKKCHREFEYSQRMSDPEKTVCETCGGELARIISRTAFQLKGGGWYKDLYGSAKPADSGSGSPTAGLPKVTAHEGPPTAAEINPEAAAKSSESSSSGSSSGGSSSGGSSSGGSGSSSSSSGGSGSSGSSSGGSGSSSGGSAA